MKKIAKHFKGNGLKAQLLKGATGTAGIKVLNLLLTMGAGILLARALGPENYGIYAFVLSVITLMGLPTKAGLPTLVVRETAKFQLQERWGHLRGLLTLANSFVIGFSIIIALVSAGMAYCLWGDEQSAKTSTFLSALPLLPLVAFGNIRGATLRGLRKVVQGQLPEEVVRPLVLIILVGGAFALSIELTPQVTMQLTVLSALGAFFIGTVLLYSAIPPIVRESKPRYEKSAWLGSLIPLSLITSIQIINAQVGSVVLGFYGLDEDVGLLRVAVSAAMLTAAALMALNTVIAPHVARLWKQGEYEKLSRILNTTARLSFFASILGAALLFTWGEELLGFLFGDEFSSAYFALLILLGGQLVNSFVGAVGLVLKQVHLEKEALIASIVSVTVNMVMCVSLAPNYGLLGVASAYALSIIMWNIINWYFALRYARLDCSIIGINVSRKVVL